jgi:phosphate transport system permease protein
VTLAIARVIGETAPLLIICGATDSLNQNLFSGQMASLPVFIYTSYSYPGANPEVLRQMAWGAALVLIIIVMALNILARVLGKVLSPKSGH